MIRPGSRQPVRLTTQPGDDAMPSDAVLWSMPLPGGEETQVLPSVVMRNFTVFEDGIYYVPRPLPDGQLAVHHLAFSSGTVTAVLPVTGPVNYGWTVSPDRRQIAYTPTDGSGRDLMLVEGFR